MTRIIKVDAENPEIDKVRIAAEIISSGGLVAFPTETVYGLGADAFNEKAVLRVFKVKNRPPGNPLIVHISDVKQLEMIVAEVPDIISTIAKIVWPGPLTFILRKRKNVPDIVTGGLPNVAVRMPAHPVALMLIKESTPIVGPSANVSGKPSPTSAKHVIEDLYGKIDVILDAGETPLGIESTIVDMTTEPPVLIRPGPITIEQLKEILRREVKIHPGLLVTKEKVLDEKAPGLRYDHYTVKTKLILVEGDINKAVKRIKQLVTKYVSEGKKLAILCTEETKSEYIELDAELIVLGSRKNPFSVARNLFSKIRGLDDLNIDIAIAEGYELKGLGFSIMYRLRNSAKEIIKA